MTRLSDIVHTDPDILGGTPVFARTRVPIQSLEGGETLDEFLRQFPSVFVRVSTAVHRATVHQEGGESSSHPIATLHVR